MNAEPMTLAGNPERPNSIRRAFAGPLFLRRFCHFIEHADWERMILSQRLDRCCIGVLVLAALYFIPILTTLLFR